VGVRYSAAMRHTNPFKLAAWLAVAGLSFGLSLGWGWLVLLGLLGPIAVLAWACIAPLLRR
jgi:2-keto-4-pentenoate hydratase